MAKTKQTQLDIEGRQVPQPNYDKDIDKLIREYQRGMLELHSMLMREDISNLSKRNIVALMKRVEERLGELDLFAKDWIEANIPTAIADGASATMVNLGLAATIEEAREVVKFNKPNKALMDAAIADTQESLLGVTDKTKTRVKTAVRQAFSEVMKANMSRGVNGVRGMSRDIQKRIYEKLGKSVEKSIRDSAGRNYKPKDYVDTAVRTKMLETYREAQTNEALHRGARHGIISYAGSKDACRFHEGRIIKLDATASGNYPTYDELKASNQIFHPRCVHHFSVYKNLDRLPSEVKEEAEKQARRGNAALQSGKRNPKDEEIN